MWIWILATAGAVIALAVLLLVALILSMRAKWEPGLRFVRHLGRDHFNKAALRTAGAPGSGTHVIRNRGRRSGRTYRTPIALTATDDGWIVMLPYGTTPDWLKNVLAAGEAEVEIDGGVHAVTDPRVVSRAEVGHRLPRFDRLVARLFGVDQLLQLRRAAVAADAERVAR
ncbi:nitroreductase family deazaflavin-dependent oxidoreductase [Microbacterium sp. JZ31]|uniref:nitroreductase family deazaflavin-dependent oxidoreductase n=1 Tax=Microbacterium sp. JZ31 TaxID=1906274 RepID=UPI001EE45D0B|nr:nitroreductase family deazaflavin-dependent oxidoreductase [Microbacterium sp. JZ31]